MNAKNARGTRRMIKREFSKSQAILLKNSMREIMSSSFMVRLKFCWMVIKGVKK